MKKNPNAKNPAAAGVKSSLPSRLKDATAPAMIEVAPNKWVPRITGSTPPEVSLLHWVSNGDATFKPVPHSEPFIEINKALALFLGFTGRWDTLLRLGRMGCIEIVQAGPRLNLLNLSSWYNHLRHCAEDPEFWAEGRGYIEEYRKVIY